tara:strand:- start:964 stop:1068 length:105 start_codon:yes stop_codon:yes gene_type:complete
MVLKKDQYFISFLGVTFYALFVIPPGAPKFVRPP